MRLFLLRDREVLQEDDEGSLQATIDEIIQKAKRQRYFGIIYSPKCQWSKGISFQFMDIVRLSLNLELHCMQLSLQGQMFMIFKHIHVKLVNKISQ